MIVTKLLFRFIISLSKFSCSPDFIGLLRLLSYALISFIPIILGWGRNFGRYSGTEVIDGAIASNTFKYALMATLSSCVPFLLDLLLDYSSSDTEDRRGLQSRSLFVVLVMGTDLFIFVFVIPTSSSYLLPCIYHMRETLQLIIITDYLSGNDSNVITMRSCRVIVSLFALSRFFASFVPFMPPNSNLTIAFSILSLLLIMASSFCGWYISYHGIMAIYLNRMKRELTHIERCSVAYLCSYFFFLVGFWVLYFAVGLTSWQSTSLVYIVSYSYLSLAFLITVTVLNARSTRQEAAQTKVIKIINEIISNAIIIINIYYYNLFIIIIIIIIILSMFLYFKIYSIIISIICFVDLIK